MTAAATSRSRRLLHRIARLRYRRGELAFVVGGLVVVAFVVIPGVASVLSVREANQERSRISAAVLDGVPTGATVTSEPFFVRSSMRAVAIATSPLAPPAALEAVPAPRRGWTEIEGTRTRTGRSFLDAAKVLVLDVRVQPCPPRSDRCPAGGAQVQVEVLPAGPGS